MLYLRSPPNFFMFPCVYISACPDSVIRYLFVSYWSSLITLVKFIIYQVFLSHLHNFYFSYNNQTCQGHFTNGWWFSTVYRILFKFNQQFWNFSLFCIVILHFWTNWHANAFSCNNPHQHQHGASRHSLCEWTCHIEITNCVEYNLSTILIILWKGK